MELPRGAPVRSRRLELPSARDADESLRDEQIAARHADPQTTTAPLRHRQNFDRHAAYVAIAFIGGG